MSQGHALSHATGRLLFQPVSQTRTGRSLQLSGSIRTPVLLRGNTVIVPQYVQSTPLKTHFEKSSPMPARGISKRHIGAMLSAAGAAVNGVGRCSVSSTAAPALQIRLNSTDPRSRDLITSDSCTVWHSAISSTVAAVASWSAGPAAASTSNSCLSPWSTRCFATGDPRSDHLDNPTIHDLEAGLSSEAVGIDEEAIDAIPASSMPVGANRTEGPGQGPSPKPKIDPEAGDPQSDAVRPPSGPSGPDHGFDAADPPAGQPQRAGPEVGDPSAAQQPEVERPLESVNPDRIPFWGS